MIRHPRLLGLCIFGCWLIAVLPGQAAKVRVWHRHQADHYEKARLQQAVITSRGALQLARQLQPITLKAKVTPEDFPAEKERDQKKLKASHVWALAEDSRGNLYVATGSEGKLYKVDPEGKVSVAYTAEGGQVLSLAVGPDDTVYAGVGPTGQVICLDARGKAQVLCTLDAAYVWALARAPRGMGVYAGTGPGGRIYQITPAGKPRVLYDSRQDHILCLATAKKGQTLYAGTDREGLIYRIDERGKAFVLYQTPQAEVRTLVWTVQGLYVGTSSPNGERGSSGGSSSSSLARKASRPTRAVSVSIQKGDVEKSRTDSGKKNSDKAEEKKTSKGKKAPRRSSPESGENSVYCIRPDGQVREVFRSKALMLSLLPGSGDKPNHLFVGTGMKGQLFEVNCTQREHSEIARLNHGQILCVLRRRDGSIVLGTGDPGKLYVLKDQFVRRGTIQSRVFDASLTSKWGALRWNANTPPGTSVSVAVRSGNVAEPDETWSDWSAEQTDCDRARITAPTARYLQYRITLNTQKPEMTPVLRDLTLRYATTNQAPELTRLEVPNLDAENLEDPKKLTFEWSATDANEDDLTYSVWARKQGWKNWVRLAEDVDDDEYKWDTTTMPSGVYRIKVVASDRVNNPQKEALTTTRISAPFVVCHTPPTVTVKQVETDKEGRVTLEAKATSPLVRVTSASFALNGKKWKNVFPTDDLFDSASEAFRFQTSALESGTYVLVLKVKDAAGNTGSGDVVFTIGK